MSDEEAGPKYPHNVLEGFGMGALLDLRVRMAFNFLSTAPFMAEVTRACLLNMGQDTVAEAPVWVAKFALAVADEILVQGAASGLVAPLPDGTELNRQLRLQAERTARYDVLQQLAWKKAAHDEANPIEVPQVRPPFNPKAN